MFMAKKEILTDDISGETLPFGAKSFEFTIQGTSYEIDLTDEHIAEFNEAIAKFISKARVTARPRQRNFQQAFPYTEADVREFLTQRGYQINSRGSISIENKKLYEKLYLEEQQK